MIHSCDLHKRSYIRRAVVTSLLLLLLLLLPAADKDILVSDVVPPASVRFSFQSPSSGCVPAGRPAGPFLICDQASATARVRHSTLLKFYCRRRTHKSFLAGDLLYQPASRLWSIAASDDHKAVICRCADAMIGRRLIIVNISRTI